MISEEKIKQVINAIKENGLSAFDDESLAKLLSIFNQYEYEEFEKRVYQELGGMTALSRVMEIQPYVELLVNKELHRIRNSSIYKLYIESLTNGKYIEFFRSLRIEELADLKKIVSYTVNKNDENSVSGSRKIIRMITREIKNKEKDLKPRFTDMATEQAA